MFIPRLYYPHPLERGIHLALDKETAHYLLTVLRLKNDERVILFNGEGGEYIAKILVDKKRVNVQILSFENINTESHLEIHLGQGLLRGDKMDFVIQKATELGVASITPLFSKNSNVKLDEDRSNKRWQHWHNIAISAAEQSGRIKIPKIHPPIDLATWVQTPFEGSSVVFSPNSKSSLKTLKMSFPIRIAIGPESGWQEMEVNFMLTHQFLDSTLGPRILRAETAGLTAISLLQGLYGDLCDVTLSTMLESF